MNRTTLALLLLFTCNSIFCQDLFKGFKVQSIDGKEVMLHDVLQGEKDQRVVLYLYISNCNFCIQTINNLANNNPGLFDGGEVRLLTLNILWDEKIKETAKNWPYENFYAAGSSFYETYGNLNTPMTIVFMNEEIIYSYVGNMEGEKTLKTVLTSHPYVRYFYQGNRDVPLPVGRNVADLASYVNKLPHRSEVLWRMIKDDEAHPILGINDPNEIPMTSDSVYEDGLYFKGGFDSQTVLVMEGKVQERHSGLETRTEVIYLNPEGAQTDKTDWQTTRYKIIDRFVPGTIAIDKTLNERTVFKRVELRDLDDNLLSYELWRGYNKELLFKYDLNENPIFDHNLGSIDLDVTIIEDESEIEDIVVETTDDSQTVDNFNSLSFELISKTELESWIVSFGFDRLKNLANQGNAIAQRRLGRYHLWVTDNQVEALNWFKKSASQSDYYGLVNLAYAYQNGRGTDKDTFRAIDYFIEAIKVEPPGKSNATWGLRDLKGLNWTNRQKIDWYLEAAPAGNPLAQYYLAHYYEKGYGGLEKSLLNAIKWYTKASEQGYEPAKKRLKEIDAAIGN